MTGKIVWWDLRTPDIETAQRFYGELLGWTFDEFEFGLVVKKDGKSIGMLSRAQVAPDTAEAGTLLYAHVDDLDAALHNVRQLGGQVTAGPTDDNDGGHFVDITDPTGVRFGLWSELPKQSETS